jgi:cyclic pyranopterin phosphate synthase
MKLRVSITDRCNFRCRYCRPTADATSNEEADLGELATVVTWLQRECGVTHVRLTGGEPLLHPGVERFVETLAGTDGIQEVTLTTNGALLAKRALPLKRAGLARVNVSLDTVDPARFRWLTGAKLDGTLAGIAAACRVGLRPLKLNAVLLRRSWVEDVPQLLDYASECDAEIRFIELMPSSLQTPSSPDEYVSAETVRQYLTRFTPVRPMPSPPTSPARLTAINWAGRSLSVGWITPRSAPFCASCDRLRLDARGRIFRCLMDSESLPLLDLLRHERPAVVTKRVASFLAHKFSPFCMRTASPMFAIGG